MTLIAMRERPCVCVCVCVCVCIRMLWRRMGYMSSTTEVTLKISAHVCVYTSDGRLTGIAVISRY